MSLFRLQEQLHRAGLYQFQPFDPDKTPVVFVHGLMSRPETWRVMVNELLADRKIRKNFQFWFFLYPTGLPVWKSAAELRAELDRFNRELAPRVSTRAQRARLRDKVLVFAPRTDVSRVVFAAVPHRGSPLALRVRARFFAGRVRFALPEIQNYRALLVSKAHEALRRDLQEPANSIRFLRENSPFLEAIWSAPQNPRVRLHSIIGDRGRNEAPHGGDGIVPYRSAHYPGADSEKIVPSGYDVHKHPEGVREVARILREVLGD